MRLQLIPFVSIGPVPLSGHREDVIRILGEPDSNFLKTPESVRAVDVYTTGLFFHYNKFDKIRTVEIFDPAIVKLREITLFPQHLDDLRLYKPTHYGDLTATDVGLRAEMIGVDFILYENEISAIGLQVDSSA